MSIQRHEQRTELAAPSLGQTTPPDWNLNDLAGAGTNGLNTMKIALGPTEEIWCGSRGTPALKVDKFTFPKEYDNAVRFGFSKEKCK